MNRARARKQVIEKLRKAILSAATLIQDDPGVSEDTMDFLEADVRSAANSLDELSDIEEAARHAE